MHTSKCLWLLLVSFSGVAGAANTAAARDAAADLVRPSFVVDSEAGRFSFVWPEREDGGIRDARLGLDVGGKTLWSNEASETTWNGPPFGKVSPDSPGRAQFRFDEPELTWTVEFRLLADGRAGTISSTIRNDGARGVQLGRCRLVNVSPTAGELALGAGDDKSVLLVFSGSTSVSRLRRIRSAENQHVSKTIGQLYNPVSNVALHLGFVSFDRINTEHKVSWSNEQKCLTIDSYCDFDGFELAAGGSVESETLLLQISNNPHAGLACWANHVAARYRPRIWPKIPSGWLGWSWVDGFTVERYEDVVRRNARAIRRRLAGFDVEYIWVSWGNLKDRLPGNWLQWNEESFPSGPEKLVADLEELDLKLGLWIGPFWLSPELKERAEELNDALLEYQGKPLMTKPRGLFVLDPTHPKTREFLKETFSTYRRWGIRYYMIDFLNAVSGSTPGTYAYDSYYDRSRIPGPDMYRAGLKVIRQAAGEDTYLLSSTGPSFQNIGLVDAARVGNDYGEGRPLDPKGPFYPGTFVINRADYWTSHRRATDAIATGYFTHRKLYIADSANVLTLDKPCPVQDAQISATIFGINGGPMMLGDDVDRMTDDRLAMIKKCLPRLPECAVPVDLFDSPYPDYPKFFHLKVRRNWDDWDVIAVFNYGKNTLQQPIALKRIGLDPEAEYVVWDFWNERYEGVRSGDFSVTVPPGSVRLLRLSKRRPHPWLASTDMHVRQGQAEIEACGWDQRSMTLILRATRPPGEKGNAFVLVPPGMEVRNPAGLWLAKDGNDGSLIVRCSFSFDTEHAEKAIVFARVKTED